MHDFQEFLNITFNQLSTDCIKKTNIAELLTKPKVLKLE